MSREATARRYGAILEAIDEAAKGKPRAAKVLRDCTRCTQVAESSERAGKPRPPVYQVESWRNPMGQLVYSGLCKGCADIEWSERWERRYAKASVQGRTVLEKELDEHTRRGRRYLGTQRPGTPAPQPPKPHAEGCRCLECRSKVIAAVQADEDMSLFPEGHAP